MALVDLIMPKMGESITEATILRWFKKVGDSVKMDETIFYKFNHNKIFF